MEIIGQNGNDGDHYNELDLNKDGKIDSNELFQAKQELKQLQNSIVGVTKSSNKVDKALKNDNRIKVYCRFKLEREISQNIKINDPNTVALNHGTISEFMSFETVFGPESNQSFVYSQSCKPLVENLFQGFNGTILAYG